MIRRHRMGLIWLCMVVLGLTAWTAPNATVIQPNQVCAPDTAHFSESAREFLESFVTDDDSLALAAQSRWGVGTLSAGSVTVEQNEADCAIASQLLATIWQAVDSTTGRVVVLKFANLRATTTQPAFITTGNQPFLITDSTFTNVVELFWP